MPSSGRHWLHHDTMINLLDPNPPAIDDIFGARFNARLTQRQAGELVGSDGRTWRRWEAGDRAISVTAWALFLLATGQHPGYKIISKSS